MKTVKLKISKFLILVSILFIIGYCLYSPQQAFATEKKVEINLTKQRQNCYPHSVHGTCWHSNFGYPMGHGCINMRTDPARLIYNWIDYSTPISIYGVNTKKLSNLI